MTEINLNTTNPRRWRDLAAQLIATHGGRLTLDVRNRFGALAPKGRVWGSDLVHELVEWHDGSNKGQAKALHRLSERVLWGTVECEAHVDNDCDWCGDVDAPEGPEPSCARGTDGGAL